MSEATVWLIDNDPGDIALVQLALARLASPVQLVVIDDTSDGVDAMLARAQLTAGVATPMLILLDIKLSGLDGIAILKLIRARGEFRQVPVVMFSSSIEPSDVVASYAAGANSYVRKPVSYEDFAASLLATVRYWTRINALPPEPRRP